MLKVACAPALVLVLAACGSSGGPSANTSSALGVTTGPGESITVDTHFSGEGSGDVCSYAKQVEQSGELSNLDTTKAGYEKARDVMSNLETRAPVEIKADIQTSEKFMAQVQAIFEKNGYDSSKLSDADLQKVQAIASDPEYLSAAKRVAAYFGQVCGALFS